jgi:hypothetical protein
VTSTDTIPTVAVRADVLRELGVVLVDAGERVDRAERVSRAEGWRDGLVAGYRAGFEDGFNAGADVGGARVLLELEHVIGRERLDELTRETAARIPHVAGYREFRARVAAGPCADPRCGACGARRDWLARHGGDFEGGDAGRAFLSELNREST